jgi:hypothetical protein
MNFLAARSRARAARRKAHGRASRCRCRRRPSSAARSCSASAPRTSALEPGGDRVALPGAVTLREVLGAEVVLHVTSPAGDVDGAGAGPTPARAGDAITLYLDPAGAPLVRRRESGPRRRESIAHDRDRGAAWAGRARSRAPAAGACGRERRGGDGVARLRQGRARRARGRWPPTGTPRTRATGRAGGDAVRRLRRQARQRDPQRQRPRPVHLLAGSPGRLDRGRRARADRVLDRRRDRGPLRRPRRWPAWPTTTRCGACRWR